MSPVECLLGRSSRSIGCQQLRNSL
jgi:hypothetical protein